MPIAKAIWFTSKPEFQCGEAGTSQGHTIGMMLRNCVLAACCTTLRSFNPISSVQQKTIQASNSVGKFPVPPLLTINPNNIALLSPFCDENTSLQSTTPYCFAPTCDYRFRRHRRCRPRMPDCRWQRYPGAYRLSFLLIEQSKVLCGHQVKVI